MDQRFHDLAKSVRAKVIEVAPIGGQTGMCEFSSTGSVQTAKVELARPEDIALLLQTSGTTAVPKIVPLTHAICVETFIRDRIDVALTPSDRSLDTMPLHHIQGLNVELLGPLLSGASVVLADFDPGTFLGLVDRYRPTFFTLVPSMHQAVIETTDSKPSARTKQHLRFVRSSSATLHAPLRSQIEAFYGVYVNEGYGSSETGNMADFGVNPDDYRVGSVGKRCHPDVVVMDMEGNELPTGQVGEICSRGLTVIEGYENDPIVNAEAFRDGWYRTGDLGYFDEDDYLFLTGRVGESIGRGGESISPQEVDAVLLAHPGVAQAASFGIPHSKLGQEVGAAIILKPGASPGTDELRSFAARTLSFAKVPKKIYIVTDLPTNGTGKIMRSELARRYSES
jgi:acyl-CoA synthetase (AMP-forming)/AMP-acid ligase II